ncbi:hypothetical protein Anas_01273 [Armadillidium nasatum]|uniref:Immunoglobulin I-set domain-containing protein n=1 Tax=Armadillidium nasatum TaxID=96803 RepID=A0A5N5T3H3_9CRUS|nr:hypothetical protein Anas_01273 [Armadillidium nasatum]
MSTSKPSVNWLKESNKVKLDSRHGVTVNEESEGKYSVVLDIVRADKTDCGTYKLIAKNEKGETSSQNC